MSKDSNSSAPGSGGGTTASVATGVAAGLLESLPSLIEAAQQHADDAAAVAELTSTSSDRSPGYQERAAAKGVRSAATKAQADAQAAAKAAASERNPNGPLHQAAVRAAKFAQLMNGSAATAEMKAAAASGPPPSAPSAPSDSKPAHWYSRIPKAAIYGVGGAAALAVVLRLILRRRK